MNLIAVEELLLMGKYARGVIILPEASKAGDEEKLMGSNLNLEPNFKRWRRGRVYLYPTHKFHRAAFA